MLASDIAHEITAQAAIPQAPRLGAWDSLRAHWPEYLMEAGLLGAFMISACAFGALLEFPGSPARQAITSAVLRRVLGGIAMGLTAVAIFYSPWGKQSGAHINPSVSLTFFRLGKIKPWDAIFYIGAQFVGALSGVLLIAAILGKAVADPAVRYAVTVPGRQGAGIAFVAELAIAFGMMATVLFSSNHQRLSRYTGLFASLLLVVYISIESPYSGMSLNVARTFGSALPAAVWNGFWVYVTAPLLGMLTAGEFYLWCAGTGAVKCCKLHHDNSKRCIFCGADGGFA
jgi:aquaporin Z